MLTDDQVKELHALYVRLTGLDVALTIFRADAWRAWARVIGDCIKRAEQPGLTLRLALEQIVEHRRRKYVAKKFTIAAVLRFGNLVEKPDLAEEDLAEWLAQSRARREQAPGRTDKASVLRATGRTTETAETTQCAPEVAAKLIADLKAAVK